MWLKLDGVIMLYELVDLAVQEMNSLCLEKSF